MPEIKYPIKLVGNKIGDGTFIEDWDGKIIAEFGDYLDLACEVYEYLSEKYDSNYYDDMDNEYTDEE